MQEFKKNSLVKFSFLAATCYLLSAVLSGCATAPGRTALPTYNINGASYVSVSSLCASENIRWEYDNYTRKIYLNKGAHRINLMAGQRLVLVDGAPQYLKYPVDIYQGMLVVPFRFKEQVLDVLFKETYPERNRDLSSTRIRKIVIDAGHGGKDPGTTGRRGLREKDVNLDIAKRLAKLLREDGVEVLLTRSTDDFISLERRVAIANSFKADLFVSIHSNANRVRSLNGLEVYYVTPYANDSKRALQAAQGSAPNLSRSSFASTPSLNLKAILWDMKYTSDRAESVKLARSVCISADNILDTKIIGIKGAPFYVLKGARMPAVLVEVGFLSNYNEERLIRNSFYRQQLAESIEQGITKYARNLALIESASR